MPFLMSPSLITIPVHNALEATLACLEALCAAGSDMRNVLVVDNGSAHHVSAEIRYRFREVALVSQPNLGFAAAANVGIRASARRGFRYTWLLNSDAVVTKDTYGELLRFMEHPSNEKVGACSPLIYRNGLPDEPDFAGAWVDRDDWSSSHHRAIGTTPTVGHRTRVAVLTGCAMFVRNDAATRAGLMDERFFLYWEDADFSFRLSKSGYALAVVPTAVVYHRVWGSSGSAALPNYYDTRNRFLMWRNHAPASGSQKSFRRLVTSALTGLAGINAGLETDVAVARAKGIIDGIGGRFGQRAVLPPHAVATMLVPALFATSLGYRLYSDPATYLCRGWQRGVAFLGR